eukprot:TRINITY_DN4884_c0_g1_i1.p1 TRINITY_DN4884_c0_g1~~TRINITY_DN4884_c0_g1_i1.p1  ORF type:complete len:116 (-),score=34.79 TRINITY_DN4884_c0_g1_i1:428-775(-)
MFGFGEANEKNDYVQNASGEELKKHDGSLMHEMIAGAAGFAAMQAYNKHQEENGKPQSYELLKEILAGFAAAEVDKLVETKGLDAIDARKAKAQAVEQAHHLANEQYNARSWYAE